MNLYSNIKKTKIICTIGPVSEKESVFKKMALAGMDVARLNFSHGSYGEFRDVIRMARMMPKKTGRPLAILQDLCGPKVRVGEIQSGSIELKNGNKIILTSRSILGTAEKISVSYPYLAQDLKPGDGILLDDGTKQIKVEKIKNEEVICKVIVGGELKSRKGVNFPGINLRMEALTKKDEKDLLFGIKEGVDFVALSFVRSADDILKVKKILKKHKAEKIGVIAKIEKAEAVERIDDIISVVDGIMVARGDLGVEIPMKKVPFVQKEVIKKCNIVGKPVITATQMLDSMIENPLPTRAEATDVANAILDGTDAVMLSAETTIGAFPIKVVETMASIAEETEMHFPYQNTLKLRHPDALKFAHNAISFSVCEMASELGVKAIVALTESGETARLISRYHPNIPIIAITPNVASAQKLILSWGVSAVISVKIKNIDDMIKRAEKAALDSGFVKKGDRIIISAGIPFGIPGNTNMLLVEEV